jgi:ubiquitin-conjugating enzyme E2 A
VNNNNIGISAAPVNNDIMKWTAVMFGPDDTVWEGGTFQLEVAFSEEFPTKPPHVRKI